MHLVWTPRARRQRQAAIDYIANEDPFAALNVLDRIEHQTDMLEQQPDLGRPGRKQGTRELVISRTPFIAVYRVKPKAKRVELLVLLHGSQQWPQQAMKLVGKRIPPPEPPSAGALTERLRQHN